MEFFPESHKKVYSLKTIGNHSVEAGGILHLFKFLMVIDNLKSYFVTVFSLNNV